MATEQKTAEVSLGMNQPSDSRKPVTATLTIEIDGDCYISIEMTEHDFARLMASSHVNVQAAVRWYPE